VGDARGFQGDSGREGKNKRLLVVDRMGSRRGPEMSHGGGFCGLPAGGHKRFETVVVERRGSSRCQSNGQEFEKARGPDLARAEVGDFEGD